MSKPQTTESIYEQARRKRLETHEANKPWHANDTRDALIVIGINPENLIEYLDWLRETPR